MQIFWGFPYSPGEGPLKGELNRGVGVSRKCQIRDMMKKPFLDCTGNALTFCFSKLCVHIFRHYRSDPETNESGIYHSIFRCMALRRGKYSSDQPKALKYSSNQRNSSHFVKIDEKRKISFETIDFPNKIIFLKTHFIFALIFRTNDFSQ